MDLFVICAQKLTSSSNRRTIPLTSASPRASYQDGSRERSFRSAISVALNLKTWLKSTAPFMESNPCLSVESVSLQPRCDYSSFPILKQDQDAPAQYSMQSQMGFLLEWRLLRPFNLSYVFCVFNFFLNKFIIKFTFPHGVLGFWGFGLRGAWA